MPQKKNPWRSENISSLAKIERSLVGPALEGIVTWHERDLSQSASERFIIPEAFVLLDHMLGSMIRILSGLRVNEVRIQENLMKYKDPMMSESVMIALVNKGVPRQEAHKLLQKLVFKSQEEKRGFGETLIRDPTVMKHLAEKEVSAALEPRSYIGMSPVLVDAAVKDTAAERRARGLQN